jgi:hypothetical protein
MGLARLIIMCWNEMYSEVCMSSTFPIENDLKQEDALSSLLFNFLLEYAIRMIQENHVKWDISAAGLCWWWYFIR